MNKFFPLACFAAVALASSAGCTNLVSSIVGSSTVYCSSSTAGTETSCVITKNIPSSETGTVQSECTSHGGTLASSCPTSHLVGCCSQSEAIGVIETCFYAGTASALQSQCSGAWTPQP